jgi:hypothetical protein
LLATIAGRGEQVGLFVSTDAPTFDVAVVREGAGSEPVWSAEGIAGRSHDTPEDASSNGCGWPPALEIPVGRWRSGYHAVTVTVDDERADAFLVVRPDPSDPAPILLVLSTTTWHAYNDWGGPSLYTGGTRVSFERPLAKGFLVKPEPIGRMMQHVPDREAMGFRNWARPLGLSEWCGGAGWFTYERTFTRWAETNGYRVDVAISQDLEEHPRSSRARIWCSASATTSTGRGACATRSMRSWGAAATRRSCRGTRRSGR